MNDLQVKLAKSRQIIASACAMLCQTREHAPRFAHEPFAANADCYVLLCDASKMFCALVCEQYGEPATKRWSTVLPELLMSHPDKCRETLALVEEKEFKELSYFQFDAA